MTSYRILWRYLLFQIPGILFVGLIAYGLVSFEIVSPWKAVAVVFVWVAKDAVLYPIVWRAYAGGMHHNRTGHVGRKGIVKVRLNPTGMIRIDGTLWQATHIGDEPIDVGDEVFVTSETGLVLNVERAMNRSDDN